MPFPWIPSGSPFERHVTKRLLKFIVKKQDISLTISMLGSILLVEILTQMSHTPVVLRDVLIL